MKFANLGGLSEDFINENYNEEVEEGMLGKLAGGVAGSVGGPIGSAIGAKVGDKLTGEEEEGIAPMDDDMPADELGGDEGLGDEELGDEAAGEELPPEAVAALEKAVEAAADAMLAALAPFGVEGEASVEGDEAPVDDLGDEAPVDDLDAAPELPGDEGPEDEEVLDEVNVIDEEEVVQETMTRVIKRLTLLKEAKKEKASKDKMIDSVADAIIAKLRANK